MQWLLVTASFLVTSGHSGLVVSRLPCCLAVGHHCLVPCDPVSDIGESLGQESLQRPCSHSFGFPCVSPFSRHAALWVFVASGYKDSGPFCRFLVCCTLNTSGQAFVHSDAIDESRLGLMLMSRKWLPEFGACFAALFCGLFVHFLVWGEGMYASLGLHMWLPPFAEGLPQKQKNTKKLQNQSKWTDLS